MQTVLHTRDLDWKAFVADTLEGYALKPRVIGDEYTDAYSVDIVRVAPNGFSASHIDQARHAFFILEGEGRVTIGTETHIVYPGSVVKIPPGIPHAVNNDGAYVLVFLAIYDPPRKRS